MYIFLCVNIGRFFFFFKAVPCGLWEFLVFQGIDQTWALAVRTQSPNHWTARKFPANYF